VFTTDYVSELFLAHLGVDPSILINLQYPPPLPVVGAIHVLAALEDLRGWLVSVGVMSFHALSLLVPLVGLLDLVAAVPLSKSSSAFNPLSNVANFSWPVFCRLEGQSGNDDRFVRVVVIGSARGNRLARSGLDRNPLSARGEGLPTCKERERREDDTFSR
jgi:hypothetical protein